MCEHARHLKCLLQLSSLLVTGDRRARRKQNWVGTAQTALQRPPRIPPCHSARATNLKAHADPSRLSCAPCTPRATSGSPRAVPCKAVSPAAASLLGTADTSLTC